MGTAMAEVTAETSTKAEPFYPQEAADTRSVASCFSTGDSILPSTV